MSSREVSGWTYREILKEVFTHMWGLVVVDHLSRIVFVEEKYARGRGFDPETVIGRYIKEVIPESKLPTVVESGKPILGDIFYHQGKPLICNRFPLVKDGVLIGAMSFQVFRFLLFLSPVHARGIRLMKQWIARTSEDVRSKSTSYAIFGPSISNHCISSRNLQ